jgi:hypothetical protein
VESPSSALREREISRAPRFLKFLPSPSREKCRLNGIEIDQNQRGLAPSPGPKNTALLQNINDARSAR